MELGGNAPFLVFEDADLDAAIDGAMLAKMRNIGEACTAANRFHVHESARRGVRRGGSPSGWAQLKVGRGTEPDTDVGPLIDEAQRTQGRTSSSATPSTAARACSSAASRVDGPRLLLRARPCSTDVPDDAALLDEEIFGPVAPDRHLRAPTSRRSPPPTAPSTGSSPTSTRATSTAPSASARRIETGMVGLNQGVVSNPAAPFGGVKQSGFGREGGFEGIGEYLETKYVAMAT